MTAIVGIIKIANLRAVIKFADTALFEGDSKGLATTKE